MKRKLIVVARMILIMCALMIGVVGFTSGIWLATSGEAVGVGGIIGGGTMFGIGCYGLRNTSKRDKT